MKQLLLDYGNGEIQLQEVPAPALRPDAVLVHNRCSVVSAGTEKQMIDLGKRSLVGKARARPDLVRQVIRKVQSDGLMDAYHAAKGRLSTPVPLGYSSSGTVGDTGGRVGRLRRGQRVACFGSGYAAHADVVSVPATLCAEVPDGVSDEHAAFAGVGAIALHGVRLCEPTIGDRVVVIGLGLLGQLAVQLLRSAGCRVLGVDTDQAKVDMAGALGIDDGIGGDMSGVAARVEAFTRGVGADAVIVLASTPSTQPVELAADVARTGARVVVPGMVGLDLPRNLFYEKELRFVVPRSAGPGIYDPSYERKGIDYPIDLVRWTAQRNMETVLDLVARGELQLGPLVTHRFRIDEATDAYDLVLRGREPYVGVVLSYGEAPGEPARMPSRVELEPALKASGARASREKPSAGIGLIGAGVHARVNLLPALKKARETRLEGVATATGISGRQVGDKYGFRYCSTDYRELLGDPNIDGVILTTRNSLHAGIAAEAVAAGKHVLVEKPLAVDSEQLAELRGAIEGLDGASLPYVLVGFNRRFAPTARWLKERAESIREPVSIHCTVNAGAVSQDHWTYDVEEGGGRIAGEVCHFVDLIQYLSGSAPVTAHAETLSSDRYAPGDNVIVTLKMADGAIGSIHYASGGDRRYTRERIELFGGGAAGVIENFRSAAFFRNGRAEKTRHWVGADRGHSGELSHFLEVVRGEQVERVPLSEFVSTTLATFAIERSIKDGETVQVSPGEQISS